MGGRCPRGRARGRASAGVSPLYVTAPWGVTDQPDFHNAVVALDVPGGPDPAAGALALLGELKKLERLAGRRPGRRWGPRELDLDLLVFGRQRIAVERPPAARSNDAELDAGKAAGRLEVPHRDAGERLFVLAPLADLAAHLVPPGWAETVATRRRRVAAAEAPDAVRLVGRWDAIGVVGRDGRGLAARRAYNRAGRSVVDDDDRARGRRTTMTTIGYAAMLEQFHPTDLLDWCAQAEAAGFDAGFMVSEHFHPWTPQQGQSAFAWSFMGALGPAHQPRASGPR